MFLQHLSEQRQREVGVGVCVDTVAVTLLLDLRSCFRLNFLQAYYDHDTVRSQYRTSPSPSQSQKKDRSKEEEMAMDVFACGRMTSKRGGVENSIDVVLMTSSRSRERDTLIAWQRYWAIKH
eukprot:scaffold8904_cov90-Skeletonema_marinoi.AAC.2